MNRRSQRRLFSFTLLGVSLLFLRPAGAGNGRDDPPAARPGHTVPIARVFDITIPPPEFGRTEEGWDTIRFEGYGESAAGGEPSTPVRIFRLEIPAGTVPRLEILDSEFSRLDGIELAPAPVRSAEPVDPHGGRRPGRPLHRRQPLAYSRPGFQPGAPVEIGEVGYIRHRRYAQIKVFPVQHDPVRDRTRIYSRIRVGIRLAPGGDGKEDIHRRGRDRFGSIYRRGFRDGNRIEPQTAGEMGAAAPSSTPSDADRLTATSARLPAAANSGGFPAYRLRVGRQGVYRLTYEYLNDPATAADLIAMAPDPDDFKLTSQGVEIPLRVMNGGNPDLFEPGEFVEFFGEPLQGDFLDPDVFEQGDFTDINVYRLSVEIGARLRIPEVDGAPVAGYPSPDSFVNTETVEESDIFLGQLPFNGAGHWYFEPFIQEGRDGSNNPIPGATDFSVLLNGTGIPGVAHLEVRMLGLDFRPLHRTSLLVNGTPVGGAEDWDGFIFHTQIADFDASLLVDGTNTVTVATPLGRVDGNGDPVEAEAILLDRIELRFDRSFQADGGQLQFDNPNQDSRFQVGAVGSGPSVYDITASLPGTTLKSPVRIINGTLVGNLLTFESAQDGGMPPSATRTFVVAAATGWLQPDAVEPDAPSDLRSTANGADYIVIAHRDLYDLTPGTNLDQVLALRQAQGLRTLVVDVQDVYDEFSFGILDPQAIRDFLEYAFVNWTAPAPTFVILLGDANYDTHNHFNAPETRIFVPTYVRDDAGSALLGYYADDTYFSTISGSDPIPDLLLGRIPAHDLAEAEGYWQKVLDYEVPVTGDAWESHAVFVADEGETLFESVQDDQINSFFLSTPHTFQRIYYQDIIDANPALPPQEVADLATTQIQTAIDLGVVVINYVGHGGFQSWSKFPNIYRSLSNVVPDGATPVTDDIDPLTNGPRYPFMVNTNCITGGFHVTGEPGLPQDQDQTYSFAEDFLMTQSKGLIGAIAPSHLTFSFMLNAINNTMFGAMYGPEKERNLGNLQQFLRLTLESLGMFNELRSYVFLGDPAVTLRIPAPEPPVGVAALAANEVVDLSWAASPEAASYNMYRTGVNPAGPYVRINPAPITGTSFTDLNVVNAQTYHYTVTSIDANGFEGRYSNFNTDCATAGPDCVAARPLNPDPPGVPTGLGAADLGIGGTLLLTWIPNPEPDLAFYTLDYGIGSGLYDQQIRISASATSLTLPGLDDGIEYFFVLSASNSSGNRSAPSTEASAVPRLVLGITPPRAVRGLQVLIDGADLLLSWDPVTENTVGDPLTPAAYIVYASSAGPDFPLAGNELATVPGTVTEFRHSGAALDGADYYFLVAAEDAEGLLSGSGGELPAPVMNLTIAVQDPATLRLDWTPTGADIDGNPAAISHYALYSDAAPFSRAQIGPALLQLGGISAPPILVPLPAEDRFYSILAVDHHGSMSPY